MIFIYPISERPDTVRIALEHGPEVFAAARDYYHRHKDMRCHKAVVYEGGEPKYCLGWSKNKSVNVVKNAARGQMNISNFWEYGVDDEGLDYSYADRFHLIIYEKLEEYSYHTARVLRKHNPNLILAFLDADARLFFDDSDTLIIAESEEELFGRRPELREMRTLRAGTTLRWDLPSYFTGRVPSITIMTSLYWLKREFCYGPLNPDKIFYLIKQPVKENGLTALIANVIGTAQLVRRVRPDFIPVVDLGIGNDANQFAGDSGEDVWAMFFEQLSPYSLQEVYSSQHVVLDQNTNLNFNPYLTELVFTNQRAELAYGDDLRYNEKAAAHTKEVLDKVFPSEPKRTLAVVARGTDYLLPMLAPFVPHGITARETLEKAIQYVKEQSFDRVYLATEDQEIFEIFTNSELGDKLLYVDQERPDYRKKENENLLLHEVFARSGSDPYKRTLNYIATLEGLTRCQALLANVTCGAVTYALARQPAYEFVDVKKIG